MKTDVEKWKSLWIGLLCAITHDGCAVIPDERSLRAIQKYQPHDLYALRTVSGRLKPYDPTLDILSELGLWHYRSRRMGQRCAKQIRAIGRPVSDWDISYSDRPRPVRSRRRASARMSTIWSTLWSLGTPFNRCKSFAVERWILALRVIRLKTL